MKLLVGTVLGGLVVATAASAQTAPHEIKAREIYEKAISFRTAKGHGQVPKMAAYLADVLKAGGVPAQDIQIIPHGETAAMLVRLPAAGKAAKKPILFSAHMDVVDAKPEDWTRDPFKLVEENGFFFGRGTADNKAGVVALVSTILRLKAEGFKPQRDLVFGFVGDEETEMETTRLIAHHPWVKGAEFAINTDSGGGGLDENDQASQYGVQGAEKTYATFELTVTNSGGHSARPRDDNAIYELADALVRVRAHRFKPMANELTRSFLAAVAPTVPAPLGNALSTFAADPTDAAAADAIAKSPVFIGTTRTTCVATMLNAGHAENALPQKATATVNCRIFPDVPVESVQNELTAAVANPNVSIKVLGNPEPSPVSNPRPDVMAAVERAIHAYRPNVKLISYLDSGGTDGKVYRAAGIPTYASSGLFAKQSEVFNHGLNERVRVKSFYEAIDHAYRLAKDFGRP